MPIFTARPSGVKLHFAAGSGRVRGRETFGSLCGKRGLGSTREFLEGTSRIRCSGSEMFSSLRSGDAVELLGFVGGLEIGELVMAGGRFGGMTKVLPGGGHEVSGRPGGKGGAGRVGEAELQAA